MCDSRLRQLTNVRFIVAQVLARSVSQKEEAHRETGGGDVFFLCKRCVRGEDHKSGLTTR